MTATCPHPLANPFNTQRFTNFRIADACDGAYAKCGQAFGVPESRLTYQDIAATQQDLHVPNQDVPLGDQHNGTKVDDDYIVCPDGSTVLKISTGEIVKKSRPPDGMHSQINILDYSNYNTWIDDIISDPEDLINLEQPQGLTESDLKYWEHANKMSELLCANMGMEQVMLLAELSGYGFFKSKLVDDDDAKA